MNLPSRNTCTVRKRPRESTTRRDSMGRATSWPKNSWLQMNEPDAQDKYDDTYINKDHFDDRETDEEQEREITTSQPSSFMIYRSANDYFHSAYNQRSKQWMRDALQEEERNQGAFLRNAREIYYEQYSSFVQRTHRVSMNAPTNCHPPNEEQHTYIDSAVQDTHKMEYNDMGGDDRLVLINTPYSRREHHHMSEDLDSTNNNNSIQPFIPFTSSTIAKHKILDYGTPLPLITPKILLSTTGCMEPKWKKFSPNNVMEYPMDSTHHDPLLIKDHDLTSSPSRKEEGSVLLRDPYSNLKDPSPGFDCSDDIINKDQLFFVDLMLNSPDPKSQYDPKKEEEDSFAFILRNPKDYSPVRWY